MCVGQRGCWESNWQGQTRQDRWARQASRSARRRQKHNTGFYSKSRYRASVPQLPAPVYHSWSDRGSALTGPHTCVLLVVQLTHRQTTHTRTTLQQQYNTYTCVEVLPLPPIVCCCIGCLAEGCVCKTCVPHHHHSHWCVQRDEGVGAQRRQFSRVVKRRCRQSGPWCCFPFFPVPLPPSFLPPFPSLPFPSQPLLTNLLPDSPLGLGSCTGLLIPAGCKGGKRLVGFRGGPAPP